jgi:hypothetical protein
MEHLVGDAAQQERAQVGPTPRAHDDQANVVLGRGVDQHLGLVPAERSTKVDAHVDAGAGQVLGVPLDQSLGVLARLQLHGADLGRQQLDDVGDDDLVPGGHRELRGQLRPLVGLLRAVHG